MGVVEHAIALSDINTLLRVLLVVCRAHLLDERLLMLLRLLCSSHLGQACAEGRSELLLRLLCRCLGAVGLRRLRLERWLRVWLCLLHQLLLRGGLRPMGIQQLRLVELKGREVLLCSGAILVGTGEDETNTFDIDLMLGGLTSGELLEETSMLSDSEGEDAQGPADSMGCATNDEVVASGKATGSLALTLLCDDAGAGLGVHLRNRSWRCSERKTSPLQKEGESTPA